MLRNLIDLDRLSLFWDNVQSYIDNKKINVDNVPTLNSKNPVSSGGVYTALQGKADTTDIPDELADLSDDATHRLVTDTEKNTWNSKQTALSNMSSSELTTGTATAQRSVNATDLKSGIDTLIDNKINNLDVSEIGGSGKYISTISESNGKISATAATLPTSLPASDTVQTYSSTGTAPISGAGVAAALGTLDVASKGGAGKYIQAISETDGKISATEATMPTSLPASDTTSTYSATGTAPVNGKAVAAALGTLGSAAAKGYTTSVTSGSGDLVTSGAVYTAIDNLPEPMIFKGTLGIGGTITSLPTATAANEGFTYKVITAGTYASIAAKVGDVFVSNGSAWVIIPAGDTDSDTWRNIKINGTEKLGSGISTGAVDFVDGTNTTVSYDATGNKVSINVSPASTYSATGTAPVNGTAIAAALGTLDVSSVGGSGKYIQAISETDGKISATAANMPTSLPASDVYAWAKASTKPSYTASEVGLGNVGNFKAVSTVANQGLTDTEKANARSNIGAGSSNFSGNYNDLSNKPTIPAAANNGTLTIQKNGTNVQTFTANQSTNVTANITVPTTASDVNAAPASDVPFKFGIDSNGNYGYIKAGADTVTPFKTVGTRSSNITANGTYTALTDISKDGYSSITVAVPASIQTKTVTAGTSNIDVTPDSGYVGLSKVTVSPTPTETKSVTPTTSAQIITPSSGKYLSSVSVGAIQTETKSVTPSSSAQTVTPSSGKYLTSVSVGAVSTQEKTITSSRSAQTVTPDSGYVGLSKVTVNALAPTGTYTASSRSASLDMGATSNYRYVNTNSVPNSNSGTYTIPRSSTAQSNTLDLGATNSYRYVDAVDFGDWRYDKGYSDRNPVILWTNPNPGSNFTAKTITISGLKNYSYVFIIGRVTTTLSGYHSIMGGFEPNNLGTTWSVDSTYTGLTTANFMLVAHGTVSRMREAYYNGSTQITIGHSFNLASDDTRTHTIPISIDNSFLIPEKIIGCL